MMMTAWLTKWLDWWHPPGDAHQWRYYRCEGCHRLVTWNQIKQGGCRCMTSNRLRPAQLTVWEKARCLIAPWSIA